MSLERRDRANLTRRHPDGTQDSAEIDVTHPIPVEDLERINALCPGSAKDIIDASIRRSDAQNDIKRDRMKQAKKEGPFILLLAMTGLLVVLLLGLGILGVIALAIYRQDETWVTVLGLFVLLALGGVIALIARFRRALPGEQAEPLVLPQFESSKKLDSGS